MGSQAAGSPQPPWGRVRQAPPAPDDDDIPDDILCLIGEKAEQGFA